MTFDDIIASMTPEIYARMKKAVELGKWDNGQMLSREQKEQCLQAIIAYDSSHKSESDRVGYIQPKEHTACGKPEKDEWEILNIRD